MLREISAWVILLAALAFALAVGRAFGIPTAGQSR
jgi:hypothetical protein